MTRWQAASSASRTGPKPLVSNPLHVRTLPETLGNVWNFYIFEARGEGISSDVGNRAIFVGTSPGAAHWYKRSTGETAGHGGIGQFPLG